MRYGAETKRNAGTKSHKEKSHLLRLLPSSPPSAVCGSGVAVDYVPVKFVKKPAGAKPGMVIFTNNRTLYVTPDEGLVNSLKV